MKRHRIFLVLTAITWLLIVLAGLILDLTGWHEIRQSPFDSIWPYVRQLSISLILAITFVMFYGLKYWVAWCIVLLFLETSGTQFSVPVFVLVDPFRHTFGGVTLTFAVVVIFRVLEKFEAKYVGREDSDFAFQESLLENDEILMLGLNDSDGARSDGT